MAKQLLFQFLKNYKTDSTKQKANIVSFCDPKGSYFIPQDQQLTFYGLYLDTINNNEPVSLAEIQPEISKILIDIDFEQDKEFRLYSDLELVEFCKNAANVLKSIYFEVTNKTIPDTMLTCYIFEKPSPVLKDKVYKDGIHIMFPFICATKDYRKKILLELNNMIICNKFFNQYHQDNLVDVHAAFVPWLMYKSSKTSTNKPYMLTKKIENNMVQTKPNINLDHFKLNNFVHDKVELCGQQLNSIKTI